MQLDDLDTDEHPVDWAAVARRVDACIVIKADIIGRHFGEPARDDYLRYENIHPAH